MLPVINEDRLKEDILKGVAFYLNTKIEDIEPLVYNGDFEYILNKMLEVKSDHVRAIAKGIQLQKDLKEWK